MKNIVLALGLLGFCGQNAVAGTVNVSIKGNTYSASLPDGLKLDVMSNELKKPRFMAFASNGDLVVGSQAGTIYRLVPPYNKVETLSAFGGYPHSVAFRKTGAGEELWVAETTGLYRTLYTPGRSYQREDFELVAALPGGNGHNSRTVAVGPDQRVYVALGIRGNCSDEFMDESYPFDLRRGGVLVLDESKPQEKPALVPYASGLRNPVGITWDPQSGAMYATNNGPDHLGFDVPNEVFVSVNEGDFFGMPWYQTVKEGVIRDQCIKGEAPRPMSDVKAAVGNLPARSAPLGVAFPRETDLGGRFNGQAFIAVHGSWGTAPTGGALGSAATRREPNITLITPNASANLARVEDFVVGLQDSKGARWARPAGIAFGPDGALYFTSDADQEGLYRISLAPR